MLMLLYNPGPKVPKRRVCALTGGGIPASSQAQRDTAACTSSALSGGSRTETRHFIPNYKTWQSPSKWACYHRWPCANGWQGPGPALHTGCTLSGLAVLCQALQLSITLLIEAPSSCVGAQL